MSEPGKYVLLRKVQATSKKIRKPKQKIDKQLEKKFERVLPTMISTKTPKQKGNKQQQTDESNKKKKNNKQRQEAVRKPQGTSKKKRQEASRIQRNGTLQKMPQEVSRNTDKLKKQKPQANCVESSLEPNNFHDELVDRLKASRFRYINEQLYTKTSDEALKVFSEDENAFNTYHEGYRIQVKQWPINPLDRIIKSIKKLPLNYVIADFGCGEARLAESVSQRCYSFDLVAANKNVIACNMAHTPLPSESVNVAVFCLSLMGTNLKDFLLEANRILKTGGHLKIVEIETRFDNVYRFINNLKLLGFDLISKDISTKVFYFLSFRKSCDISDAKQLKHFSLKPCMYKKR